MVSLDPRQISSASKAPITGRSESIVDKWRKGALNIYSFCRNLMVEDSQ